MAHLSSADQAQFADARFCPSTLWKPVRPATYLARSLHRKRGGHDAPAALETDQCLNALCFIRTVTRCAWIVGFYRYSLGNRWRGEWTRSASGQSRVDQRELRDQCQAQNVAFFFKQWGGRTPKAGGNLLDGRQWQEYPDTSTINPMRRAQPESHQPSAWMG